MTLNTVRKVSRTVAIGAVATVAALAATPGIAQAGSNGQQVRACDDTGFWDAVKIRGVNHRGQKVTGSLKRLGADGCHSFKNDWWVGDIELLWYKDNSSRKGSSDCYVPKEQEGWDWVLCVKDVN